MSIKRTGFIIFAWIASIALGLFYNYALLDIESKLSNYLATFSMLVIFGIGIYVTIKIMGVNLMKLPLNTPVFCLCAAYILGRMYFFRHIHYMANTLIDGLMIAMLLPLGLMCIKNSFSSKWGALSYSFVYFSILAATGTVSGTKLMIFSGVFLILGEIIAIRLYKPENKKLWYTHFAILASLFLGIALFILSNTVNVYTRTIGFLDPQSVHEYNMLYDWISGVGLFEYFPNNSFISDINSAYAATYAHLLVCLGWIPCLLIMLLQVAATVCMIINALLFKDKSKKFLGIMSSLMIGCHLYFSIGSSFIRTPMTEFGAPFITIYGLEYCVLPVMLYIWLDFSERGVTLKGIYGFFKDVSFPNDSDCKLIDDEFEDLDVSAWMLEQKYNENKLFIISGPSGSGKTTLFKAIQKKYPYIKKTLSDTTRDIRDDEENGIDYNFIPKSIFERNIKSGHYVEYNLYDNNYYGTSHEEIKKARFSTATAMIIDVNGAENVKQYYPDAISIFIAPPSIDVLIKRIKERNTNTPDELENRIKIAKQEMEKSKDFDYVITNKELDTAISELESILTMKCPAIIKILDEFVFDNKNYICIAKVFVDSELIYICRELSNNKKIYFAKNKCGHLEPAVDDSLNEKIAELLDAKSVDVK
jgi:guanylate kinase